MAVYPDPPLHDLEASVACYRTAVEQDGVNLGTGTYMRDLMRLLPPGTNGEFVRRCRDVLASLGLQDERA